MITMTMIIIIAIIIILFPYDTREATMLVSSIFPKHILIEAFQHFLKFQRS